MLLMRLPDWVPLPGKKQYRQAQMKFDEMTYKVITQCRREGNAGHYLLGMLMDLVDVESGEGMTDEQIRNEIATLFMAGYETTAIALSWAFEYLTLYPEIMAKLQTEVDQALAGRRPALSDLPNLGYARMVLQETMRIRPPGFWLPRTAIAADTIDGYPIPTGTNLIVLNYMYHRHPDFWPEPDHFDPERFTPDKIAHRHKFAWIPFGAGQRLCIGRDFSLMEGQLALAMVLQRYQVERVAGHVTRTMLSTTLRPKNGVLVHLKRR
jgi:cytochrome P450